MCRPLAAALACLALTLATPPLSAKEGNSALEALDAKLPGELVNDPSRIDWESYGPDLEASSVVDPSIPGGGAARRFNIKRADEYIYSAGTNIPLVKPIRRGEDITIGFYARTIESQLADGKGDLRIRFQVDDPPYPGFGETVLEIGSEWAWYEVTAKAERGLRAKDGIVAIQFGRTRQVLEIGQAIIVTGATSIASGGEASPPQLPPPPSPMVLPDPLEGAGTLLNNPGNRIWTFDAPDGRYEPREDETIWLGKATRLTSLDGSGDTPKIVARLPLDGRVEEGAILLIAVAAKTVETASEDGKARLELYLETGGKEPLRFAQNRIAIGTNWQLVRLTTKAPVEIPAGGAQLILQLRNPNQVLDIGPAYLLKTEEK